MAKIRPDSLTPRMFSSVMSHDQHHARAAPGESASPENAGIEMIAATPAEIDTATVST